MWSRLFPYVAAGLLASAGCSDSSGGGTAPSLSALAFYPASAALNQGGGSVSVSYSVDVLDAGADVTRLVVKILVPDGGQVSEFSGDVSNPPGVTSGTLYGQFPISTAAITTYTVQFQVFDAGGSGSNVLQGSFPIVDGNPTPHITSLAPASATAGGPPFTLTVNGSGFLPSSSVLWGGTYLSTTYVDEATLEAQVPSYHLQYATTVQVTVSNPPPGGGTSSPHPFTVDPPPPNPVPTLTSISPAAVDAGGPSFTLTVSGSGFVAGSNVQWNGYYLPTTFVDAGTLAATIDGSHLTSVGTVNITVYSPWPGGGTSAPLTLTVNMPVQPGVTIVSLQANDLLWDPYQQKIYLSVPSLSAVNPNTVTVLDPFTGQLTGSEFAGSEPGRLALSDDGQFLYVGFGGASSVSRLVLPSLAADLEIPLGVDATYGPYYARDVQVAPGAPHAIAVSLIPAGYSSWANAVAVFDADTQRPTRVAGTSGSLEALQWGADAGALYAAGNPYWGDLNVLSVDATGVALAATYRNAFSSSTGIHFEPASGLLYGDDGRVVDPATGSAEGTFSVADLSYGRRMVPDLGLGSAFFVGHGGSSSPTVSLRAYDLTHFHPTRSRNVSFVSTPTSRLIRWGPDGVAFLASDYVVLVRGSTILPVATAANPAPAVTSLSPSSAAAGSRNLRLAVSGSGFVPGSIVRWNASDRSTTFVSSTELVAFIPASDVASAGSPEVTVTSPLPGGGTSGAVTFAVGP